jgi:putative two-component system response regulator
MANGWTEGERPVVLIVDDSPDNISLMNGLLKDEYRVKIATGGPVALDIASGNPRPDLILLDVMMPGMDGYEVCGRLKAAPSTKDIPVVFLTSLNADEDERRGLEMGAVDYMTKPISPAIFLARVKSHLALKAAADILRDKSDYLEKIVERRTQEVRMVQDVTILALASLAETRDNETGNHIRRTQSYVKALAEELRLDQRFELSLSDYDIRILYRSAPLHDIGKVGVPDSILLKRGRLEPEEFEQMKRHTALGKEALESAERALGSEVEFLKAAKEIALSHHERWDGKGYPQGLAGEAIPLSARLMAVADVYDALISKRVYKEGMPHGKAVGLILEGRGSQFDPDVVEAFDTIKDEFESIAASLSG